MEIEKQSKEQILEKIEQEEIPELLKDPNIFGIINKEFDRFIVDEEETRKAIFICGCGAFVGNLSATFNVLVNGESSAGKSWISKNVLLIFPDNVFSKITYRTRISPNALTYWHNSRVEPEWSWDGKVLYLEDIGNNILNCDVFKVMISEGSTATIVGKKKGQGYELPATFDVEIIGKPITFVTTAAGTPVEEIKNRFLLIDLDESASQTQKIMERQMEKAISGKKDEYDKNIRDALAYLKRVKVIIPDWIRGIINFIPRKDVLRWRREFPRFLEIIKCSAALHQFQREEREGCIIANELDYEIARGVIGKISASSGIEGLTHREKMSLQFVKDYYKQFNKGCTRAKIYAYKPVYSDRQWERLLEKLAEKGLLSVQTELDSDTNRKSSHYYPNELRNLVLPEFIKLNVKPDLTTSTGSEGKNLDKSDLNQIKLNLENQSLMDMMDVMAGTSPNNIRARDESRESPVEMEGEEEDISKKASIRNSDAVTSITSTTIMIEKDGEVCNLTLEAGHKYLRSYFGDGADSIIEILEKEGKIKQ